MMTFDTAAFEAALEQAAQQLVSEQTLAAAAHAGAEVVQEAIQGNIEAMHIVKTGRYLHSWETVDGPSDATSAEAETQSDVDYGPHLEYGTQRMAARPAGRNAIDSPDVHDDVLGAMAGEF